VDRRALPAPEAVTAPASEVAFVAPAGDLEETIAASWRQVLQLPKVGTRDNFFDLGGHSLLAVQVHRKLCVTLGRNLSITDIFRFPTIESLATYLVDGNQSAGAHEGVDRAEGRRLAMQRRRQSPKRG
jgi:acyl carrier protein